MPPTTKDFLERLRKSQLVDASKLDDALTESPVDVDVRKLARHLIRNGLLTKWQCQQILEGRYKGFVLGKYKLLDQIGRGGMSMVYLAEHIGMRREVALKVLPKSKLGDKSFFERFQREAQASAALNHPNIVRAFDFDNQGDTYYLVMEHVVGSNLREIVDEHGPLSFDAAVDYISQAAAGLSHAHAMGMVHRDIKPANLLVDNEGKVKVLDLGLALIAESENSSVTLEHDEKVLGTADYLAPEQALSSHDVDARADIYALGGTFYFALTGQPPYPAGTVAQKIAAHQSAPPPDPRASRRDCPDDLALLCLEMMQKDVANRLPTASNVVDALECWLAGEPIQRDEMADDLAIQLAPLQLQGTSEMEHSFPESIGMQGAIPVSTNQRDESCSTENLDAADVRLTTQVSTAPVRRRRGTPFWVWLFMLVLCGLAGWMYLQFVRN